MSLFGTILEKLGLRKDQDDEQSTAGTSGTAGHMPRKPSATSTNPKATTTGKPTGTAPTSSKGVSTTTSVADKRQQENAAVKHDPSPAPARPTTAAPRAMSEVDVRTMLEDKAKGTGLNWKQSISDLLSLLDLDNSYEARVELAKELNAPEDVMGDSARMNTWLHKEVMRRVAANGGNIPQELLD